MLKYMLHNDVNNWVHYYASAFILPVAQGKKSEFVPDLSGLFAYVMTGYILDVFHTCLNVIHVIMK